MAAAAVVLSDAAQWDRPELLILMLALALAGDRVPVTVGEARVSMVDAGVIGAAVLAGPAPALVIGVVVMSVDALLSHLPRHALIANLAANAAPAVVAGAIVIAAVDWDLATPGTGAYIAVVALAAVAFKALNLSLLIYARGIAGFSRRQQYRDTVLPLLPWEAVSVATIAATAHIYVTVGIEAVLGLGVVLLFFRLLLENLAAAEQRQREIARIAADRERYLQDALAAEERERARIAGELHDDALQTLLSARADLVDGLNGEPARFVDARDAVIAAVGRLRDLMVRLGPAPGTAADIASTVHGLADRISHRAGFRASIDIDARLASTEDPLVVHIVRELLTNVAKHARATQVEVRIAETADGVVVEVTDDGLGFDAADRERAAADGHIGLLLLEQRAGARSGTVDIHPHPGGGTVASITLASQRPRSPA